MTDTTEHATGSRQPDKGRWWTLVAVCTGVFMLLLDVTIVNVALPDIQGQFDASLSGLQWVIDAYALSLAALLLTAGSLADIFGRRKVFVIGTALFTLGSLLCGLAPEHRVPRDRPGRPGHRRRRDVRDLAGDPRHDVHRQGPRRRLRRLRRDHRRGRGDRPGARRHPHQRPVVALDLLRQPADLPGRDVHLDDPGPGVQEPARRPPGLDRLRHLQLGARPARLRPDRGRQGRLGRPRRSSPAWSPPRS